MPCATHMADFDFGDVIGATELITFAYKKAKNLSEFKNGYGLQYEKVAWITGATGESVEK